MTYEISRYGDTPPGASGARIARRPPEMALLDLLGRGWALRVLWELRDGPALTFRGLQSRCGDISSSVLNDRPRELRGAGIVTAARGDGYRLSSEGRRLLQALAPLSTWARRGSEDEAQTCRPRIRPRDSSA